MIKSTLSPEKRITADLDRLLRSLIEKFKPSKIYSFSTIISAKIQTGCFGDEAHIQEPHHFILMIMETSTRNEHEAQDFCRVHFSEGKITILSHGIETINECIRKNNRFFITILNEGKILYNNTGILAQEIEIPFDPSLNFEKAKRHFEHRIELAQGFLDAAADSYANQHYAIAVFLTHQVIEQCTIALIRVNLAYRSDIHHLGRQLDLCCCFSEEPSNLFRTTKDDLLLFEILLRSYSQARYKDTFKVDSGDADKLVSKAYAFFELTKKICTNKIAEFKFQNEKQTEMEVGFE
ncbi:HEPN domain-containing protein [Pedobacter sp. Leaf250]|uniref:HEPN domain-containing protein n=1 Tax=Pedobacter sp. Leaf250 TaxID=2876559 RepID=UPI001E5E5839|nr:HEPN domain-containing protein [Pedobacter sp. Leaf250]